MQQEQLDMAIRRFLKEVGITSHRALAEAVAKAEQEGRLSADTPVALTMTLEVPELGLTHQIEGTLDLNTPD
ncbi:DUF6494 family protein [Ferrimonas balearica]|uniref:DUF6494 family protein n=1 Tax=Ferrimonas balearica TaxID=44012 RepID=UPI001C579204|nr:hypothetical protein [Ferrimonas balearica]MBY5981285.1 hypothetical protein [Ferrimonas balearica]MBY6107681.1 hypothetical protein [Ferrimonas balearica]MBY6226676.1 hypothetical protein [Ferrimonas balearica]